MNIQFGVYGDMVMNIQFGVYGDMVMNIQFGLVGYEYEHTVWASGI